MLVEHEAFLLAALTCFPGKMIIRNKMVERAINNKIIQLKFMTQSKVLNTNSDRFQYVSMLYNIKFINVFCNSFANPETCLTHKY